MSTVTVMVKGLLIMGVLSIIAAMFGCGKAKAPPQSLNSQFAAGQVWKYKTRPVEPESRVIIGRIEKVGNAETIIHVKLTSLRINNPGAPGGVSTFVSHTPISEDKLKESVTELEAENGDLDGFEEGYNTWQDAHRTGGAGFFTTTLSEIIEFIEEAFNKGRPAE